MADVKNVITLGIGAAPGNIKWFITVGLDTSPALPRQILANVIANISPTLLVDANPSPTGNVNANPTPTESVEVQ